LIVVSLLSRFLVSKSDITEPKSLDFLGSAVNAATPLALRSIYDKRGEFCRQNNQKILFMTMFMTMNSPILTSSISREKLE
jgi:hypothetical protein